MGGTVSDDDRRQLLEPRLYDVARLVAEGWPEKAIAMSLGVSRRTLWVRVNAIAFLIHAQPDKDTKIQIARWWESHEQRAA